MDARLDRATGYWLDQLQSGTYPLVSSPHHLRRMLPALLAWQRDFLLALSSQKANKNIAERRSRAVAEKRD